jgi:uncharacterized protein YjbI with pentapeptide repeats
MCKMASFWHNPINGDIAVYDLTSHSGTQEYLKLNEKLWREGHYLPSGEIECRVCDGDREEQEECNERLRNRFPTFKDFLLWALTQNISGSLDLRGCDLKGITLPQSIGGWLYLRGCDLKGITLPQSIGGWLDLRGCDLKGITLPQSIGGSLDLRGCDLKGITLPQKIGRAHV